jgi:hypothetical protein
MRPLELLLVLVNLLTFGVLAVPQLHAMRWTPAAHYPEVRIETRRP